MYTANLVGFEAVVKIRKIFLPLIESTSRKILVYTLEVFPLKGFIL